MKSTVNLFLLWGTLIQCEVAVLIGGANVTSCDTCVDEATCNCSVLFACGGTVCPKGQDCLSIGGNSSCFDPCQNYTVLDDPWRSTNHYSSLPASDASITWQGWYRLFVNQTSVQMPQRCISENSCGTRYPLWIRAPHPSLDDGVVRRRVCGSDSCHCCSWESNPIHVKACPGNYFVYKLVSPNISDSAYCADINTIVCGTCKENGICVSEDKVNWRCQINAYTQIRLTDGPSPCAGRVEVYHNGQWGTVCDTNWDMKDAEVVCRQLGCGSATSALDTAYFGPGTGPVWLGNVQCSGSESSLTQCSHQGIKTHNCTHDTDTAVNCSANIQIRLSDGMNSCSGRVEMYTGGQWRTWCDAHWDLNGAEVVCRQLGCNWSLDFWRSKYFGQRTGETWNGHFQCSGNEFSLTQCSLGPIYTEGYCTHEVGVFCSESNECVETPGICGNNAICTNTVGSFFCVCKEGMLPSPSIDWQINVTVCKDVTSILTNSSCGQGKSDAQYRLDRLNEIIQNTTSPVLSPQLVERLLVLTLDAVTDISIADAVRSGDEVLKSFEKLVSALVEPTSTHKSTKISTESIDLQTFAVGPNANLSIIPQLTAKDNIADIDLMGIAKNNNGSAAVVFMAYNSMHKVLKPTLFYTETDTVKIMMSNVISASLVKTNKKELTQPVNFTLRHTSDPNGQLTCVYWNESAWIVDGCRIMTTNSTHTVCACVHLSTFALIMQTGSPPEDNSNMELISTVLVSVGLVSLALVILIFIVCRKNPKVNNPTRFHLSLCLFLAHLLFMLVQKFLQHINKHKMLCAGLAGVLHFLFLSSFMWMSLESVQLFLIVHQLKKIRASEKEVIHWRYLLPIGYGLPCLVVGVSIALVTGGYGSEKCWLKMENGLQWSFLGPVCFLLICNILLFVAIIRSLQSILAHLHGESSKMRDTRIMVLKAALQCLILGCPWILGFFVKGNKMLEILFLLFNSQQGTFIFLVHCVLNKEVQEQCRQWWQKPASSG